MIINERNMNVEQSLQSVTVHTSVCPMCIWDVVHIVEPGCGWVLNVIFHTWTRATLNTTGHCNYVHTINRIVMFMIQLTISSPMPIGRNIQQSKLMNILVPQLHFANYEET